MAHKFLHCSHGLSAVMFAAAAFVMFAHTTSASGHVEKVLYSFQGTPDGGAPGAGLVTDASGNLYGTTFQGGNNSCDCGTVFELKPPDAPGDTWTETVLYSFQSVNNDGNFPRAGLVFDKMGNLYGTTQAGGIGGLGTVFELSPPATEGGIWTETVICFFSDISLGEAPFGSLTFDGIGSLYGMTVFGGSAGVGNVFQLKPPTTPGGVWTEKVLHSFGVVAGDGTDAGENLFFSKGALYGGARGGTNGLSIVFQLVLKDGRWSENILHNFTESEGWATDGGVIADSAGKLYGVVTYGANANAHCLSVGCGAVFELSPPLVAGDPWQETTLYRFSGNDGANPSGQLTRDKSGNIFGTTLLGGLHGQGTIFKLKPPTVSGGTWTEVTLHSFGAASDDGSIPAVNKLLLVNTKGLYGATQAGGSSNLGTVFNWVP